MSTTSDDRGDCVIDGSLQGCVDSGKQIASVHRHRKVEIIESLVPSLTSWFDALLR